MDAISSVMARMSAYGNKPALYWQDREISYVEFLRQAEQWVDLLRDRGIGAGAVCGVLGDYSPQTAALFLALFQQKAILVPFTRSIKQEMASLISISGVQYLFEFDEEDHWTIETTLNADQNKLISSFRIQDSPGLVVFTSGSTGKPKGILHDIEKVMRKFVSEREGWRTVLFLMMDHFGGFNTLLSTFAYGGTGICISERLPDIVCQAIQQSKATLLPTTPTFLNIIIASRVWREYDLSSIKLITYGTEVMSETTLLRLKEIFPNAQIKQTYGLSELGVLRSSSENNGSVWVKVGGTGFDIKIVDGILWVRSEANMVGYLNAPSPFDADGWMCTGDRVDVQGEYIRFLGRESEIINVGGQKVYPVEVEAVLLQDENVSEVAVYGTKNSLMGQVVEARVTLRVPEAMQPLTERLRKLCLGQLAKYKVPVHFVVVDDSEQHNVRYKKVRQGFAEKG